MQEPFVNNIKFKGEPCVKMNVGKYSCVIAPRIGGNCLRLYDCENMIELVNFDNKIPMKWIRYPSILCGMPAMLFPNRLEDGIIKSSDASYEFPVNEKDLNNYIHGFIHSRRYHIVSSGVNADRKTAKLVLEYNYDENDPFYDYFPVRFDVKIIYTLTEEGLLFNFKIKNLSDVMLPVGVGNHTSMRAPFVKRGKKKNMRIQMPVTRRVELNDRFLPTGKFLPVTDYEKQYVDGTMMPVFHDIDSEMYEIGTMTTPLGKEIHGLVVTDIKHGKSIVYEVDDLYKYFVMWNCGGEASFFCPEPISWMINAPNVDLPDEITGYRELAPGEIFEAWQKLYTEITPGTN